MDYKHYLKNYLSLTYNFAYKDQWEYNPLVVFKRVRKIFLQEDWADPREWKD